MKNFEKWVENLTENRVDILKNIHKNSKITIRELSENIGLSLSVIDKTCFS
ncbi:winged helix-turn-helix domain-containing protein [Flavobacterium jejuense]|jgi:ATP-dependent DNA helicase RecG|uniref:Winged helix-turn-helix domain-containing protein n=1 Tax=Flavobacterium jejuense TaxID=1544455 RepID=A0ABX0IUM5_9FLAO|nr:winged helix-turn-helix domain-containing protein [Flavobacterium jejuense]NHN27261.1 winged helix-turn-helix domain-containing protein [Flavobacterium jejuense]